MEFFETPSFTRRVQDYLDDEGYRALQASLAQNPALGDVMPATGGFRKLRWADPRRGKGRRGGLRIIYYHFPAENEIWLMTLTPAEKKALRAAIAAELRARELEKARQPKKPRRY